MSCKNCCKVNAAVKVNAVEKVYDLGTKTACLFYFHISTH